MPEVTASCHLTRPSQNNTSLLTVQSYLHANGLNVQEELVERVCLLRLQTMPVCSLELKPNFS